MERTRPFLNYNSFRRAVRDTVVHWSPDVVHAHDLATLLAAFDIAKKASAQVVYDAHEFATLEVENEHFFPSWYKKHVENKLIRRTAAMITVSEGFARTFVETYGIPRPTVIYNTPQFYQESELGGRTVRGEAGLDSTVPLAVYLGGLNPRRALSQIVEALSLVPWLHMAKVGGRSPRWEEMLLAEAEKFGVLDRLHILDAVLPEEIVHYCVDGDFGIVPRIRFSIQQEYSMPNKLFESVFGGLSIAYGDTQELREFVERFGVGIVMDCTDPQDIARGFEEVYERREELRPTPEKIEEMLAEFGWPAQAEKLIATYETLVSAS